MGRKRKDAGIQERISKYLDIYELDELNEANDLASIRQMVQLEVRMENLHIALSGAEKQGDDKKMKNLHTSLRDASNSYNAFQESLGVARKKRASESDETPLSYIDKLRIQAKQIIDKRLKKLICPNCNQLVMKYHIYVTEKGDEGALVFENKTIELLPFSIQIECPKCGKVVDTNERKDNN